MENRLVSVTKGTHRSEFEYDPLGRRSRILEKDSDGQGGWTTGSDKRYLWEGAEIVEEEAADGSTLKAFYGQGFVDTDGTALFYTRDHLGSVRELVDGTGAVRARYDYDPYGRMTKTQGDKDSSFTYTGHFWHAQSGLNLTLFRAYSPELGRWISSDPLGENGGVNLYAYVASDPIGRVDPLGLSGTPFRFPTSPSGLPGGWTPDKSHSDPNGERFRSPDGDHYIDFHKGRPGEKGWKGKDHWHPDGEKKHYKPGDEAPFDNPDCPDKGDEAPDAKPRDGRPDNFWDLTKGWPWQDGWTFRESALGRGLSAIPSPSFPSSSPGGGSQGYPCPICGLHH